MPQLRRFGVCLSLGLSLAAGTPALAQQPTAAAPVPAGVAATVNGQPITEASVQRGLKRVPPAEHPKARPEILNYLIDNLLIDQYLAAQKIPVEAKDVEGRVNEIKSEVKKHGQDYAKMLTDLMLTEEELRSQIAADLRWEKYATAQGTDAALKQLYDKCPEMFDGSMVRARHILLIPPTNDPAAGAQAKAQLAQYKQQLEADVAKELAQLPASADPLARDLARTRRLEDKFGELAAKHSACPSKKEGGDLSWFPRAGSMVEPFAAAAFALKPGQISDPVQTPFGYHLILCTGRKAGQAVKFEEVKEEVREIFCQRLRDSLVAQLRPAAKIAITPMK
jgi:peptidyl-prolyl cis-trans isomerase C